MSQSPMDVNSQPPATRASLACLPTELKDHIFGYVFEERVKICLPPARCPNSPFIIKRSTRPSVRATMRRIGISRPAEVHLEDTEKQKAYLLPKHVSSDEANIVLRSKYPMCEVDRTFRADTSSFLRLATIDVVTEVVEFDFAPIQRYLSSIPRSRLEDFCVSQDGCAKSTIRVDVRRPTDTHRAYQNLLRWLQFVDDLAIEELATSYRVTSAAHRERYCRERTDSLLTDLYWMHEGRVEGPAKTDLYQMLGVWFARRTVEEHLWNGHGGFRTPSPDDVPGIRTGEHTLLYTMTGSYICFRRTTSIVDSHVEH